MQLIRCETKNDIYLLKSEPFQSFETDCNQCKNFYTIPLTSPSGECLKHTFSCGYGFTCQDFKRRTDNE